MTQTALITGASTGIGAVYADRLAKRGFNLVLVARNQQRLEALAEQLRKTGREVRTVVADLTNKQDLARIEGVLRDDASIAMLVNNAGVGSASPLLASNVDKMEDMIDLNVTALTRLTYAIAPKFVERKHGTFINIASVVGISPETLNGVYGATKAFVIALSHSLQHELADKGIRVQAVLPGATATEFWDVAGYPHSNLPKEIVMTAEDMVDASLKGLDLGEKITIPSLPEIADWDRYEAGRRGLAGKLSLAQPAKRYR